MLHLPPRRTRQAAVSAVALLALGSLAGCGGTDDESASDDPASAASTTPAGETGDEPTDDASSAPATGGEEIDAQEFIDVYTAALDQATTATITMSVDGPTASTIDGAIDFTREPPSVQMKITSDQTPQAQEILVIDGAVYIQTPDETYYKTDVADSPLSGGPGGSALDPRALIGEFQDSIISATAFGEEDIDGEVFTHYAVVLDAKALAAAGGQGDAAAVGLPDEFAFDTYFDSQGLLRRITIDLGAAAGLVDVRYDDWGQPVSIKAPPKGQVQQIPGN